MFDPAILLSLEAAMTPQPPAATVAALERLSLNPLGEQALQMGLGLADSYDREINGWLARMDAIKASVQNVTPANHITPEEYAKLTEFLEQFERYAKVRAIHGARLKKRVARDTKAHFRIDPSLGAATRATGARFIAAERRVVEGLLDYALFLRALRAEGMPESRGGPTFDNADDLSDYLDSIIAA